MKKLVLPILVMFSIVGFSQITIDETLTTQQLVQDILISGTCAQTSNFVQLTGTDFGDDNGIGSFDGNGSDFPFASGVILTSGNVANAAGPNLTIHSDGGFGWPGDADLEAVTTATNTNNASWIQFDFVPFVSQISFDFIMASEEYNQNFECSFSDAFAFILTDQITGVVQNLAVLPGTVIPIEVTNIREAVPGQCAAVNPEYFDKYNFEPFNIAAEAAIDLNGQTVELTAMGPVIIGNPYTIKLVIADETDTAYDIAVFLEAGSFNIGSVDLGIDLTTGNGNARCEGESYEIIPQLVVPPGTTFEWQFENPLGSGIFVPFVPAETGPTLIVTTTGRYKLIANLGGVCTSEGEVFIEFDTPFVINYNPAPLVVCDIDNDGFADFDLTLADLDITGGDPDLSVTYHGTLLDAQNGILPLASPYTNDTVYNDSVWARVESAINSCFDTVELFLEVRNSPMANIPEEPLRLCDDIIADGFTFFDLTVVEPEVLGGMDPTEFDIYYYVLEADAIVAGDLALTVPDFSLAIATPTNFLNSTNPQEIYILVVGNATSTSPPNPNGASGCYDIVPLTLIVDPLPLDLGPFEMILCDDELNGSTSTDEISTFDLTSQNMAVTGGDITLSVTWYETPADEMADNPIVDPTMYQNIMTPQTIIGRVATEFDCRVVITMTLTVLPNPTPNLAPTPLALCDDDDDGIVGGFDLTLKDVEIVAGEPDVSILYYEDLTAAQAGVAGTEIISPYTNIVPFSQIVYARITRDVPPGMLPCFTIVELELVVVVLPDMPVVGFLDPMTMCDDDGDGQAEFDLTLNDPFVLGTQDPVDFVIPITYYELESDAISGINAIVSANAFISGGQSIWVRLESLLTGCFRITPFELEVGTFPVIGTGDDLFLCDDQIGGSTSTDGLSTFDLTLNTLLINLGDVTLELRYYGSAVDQMNDIPVGDATAYQNIITPGQEIFVTVFNFEGCSALTSFFINVDPNPDALEPTPLVACDDDYDGFYPFFDLTSKDVEIANGEGDVVVSYYETLVLADLGNPGDALVSPYTNIIPFSQTIYGRVTRDIPGSLACYTVVSMELIVDPLPDDTAQISDEITCQLPFVGIESIILDDKDPEVLNGQDPAIFDVQYYESASDAMAMTGAIASGSPYIYDTNARTIYVGILNIDTGCYTYYIDGINELSFILVVKEGTTASEPSLPYTICDNYQENDGIGQFTLRSDPGNPTALDPQADALSLEILDGQDPMQFIITFHETLQTAESGTDPLPNIYINIINPQLIYARVTNEIDPMDENSCYAIVEVILEVEELPVVVLEQEYRLCVDSNGNPIPQEEGEVSPPVIDTGLDGSRYSFLWSLEGVILPNEIGPSITALMAGVYEVVVTELQTGCQTTAMTTVVVSSPPQNYDAQVTSNAFDTSHTIEASASGQGVYIFQLDDGPFQDSGTFTGVEPGSHIVTIKDANGCGSVTIELGIIDYPRIVTPNQDGFHDTWNIIGIANGDPSAKIYIFDKFGKLLKQLSPLGPGWDGTYNGNPLPSSDYWFRVEYKENESTKEFKGHFTLKR